MWRSLSAFYNSVEWRSFRERLIFERADESGIIHDEITGDPIIKRFDIIAHHKQELTMANVNDYSISLNPDNIQLVSARTHNELHSRFGYAQGRKIYYVYGAPNSGKSTFVQSIKGNSDLIVDIDLIWQAITGDKYSKPAALKACAFGLYNALYDMAKTRAGKWERAYIITGGASKSMRERQLTELGAEPIFIDTDKETCKARLSGQMVKDPQEWGRYIDDWFERFVPD